MSRESVILAGRKFSEEAFTATCTIRRPTGQTVTDPTTLVQTPTYSVVHTGVPCKINAAARRPDEAQLAGQMAAKSELAWHVPMTITGVLTNDEATIDTVSASVGDPDLIGRKFRVTGEFVKSFATARRFPVEDIT